MSDKDLVFRGDVKAFKQSFIYDGGYPDVKLVSAVTIEDIDSIQPVPHEMSAREYLMVRTRMCYKYEACEGCPLNIINEKYNCLCFEVESQSQEEAVAVVEKWAKEHPEERSEE